MSNSLVVFFSRVGESNISGTPEIITKGYTEIVAEKIAKYTDSDIFKLEPEEPYPYNYDETVKRAQKEYKDNEIVLFKNALPSLNQYNIIYLGFPNWWRSYPRIITTFLKSYNLIGKVIKPFCTNEEGTFGIGELELKSDVQGALIKSGYAVKSHEATNCDETLKKWLEK